MRERNLFKILLMFGYFLGVKLCKFDVHHNPSSSQHYDRPHRSFRCNIESKHFTRKYSFNTFAPNFLSTQIITFHSGIFGKFSERRQHIAIFFVKVYSDMFRLSLHQGMTLTHTTTWFC